MGKEEARRRSARRESIAGEEAIMGGRKSQAGESNSDNEFRQCTGMNNEGKEEQRCVVCRVIGCLTGVIGLAFISMQGHR